MFHILATCTVISGWVPTYDSVHSWQIDSVAPLGNQATGIMTRLETQSVVGCPRVGHQTLNLPRHARPAFYLYGHRSQCNIVALFTFKHVVIADGALNMWIGSHINV